MGRHPSEPATFPLCHIQSAYVVGEQAALPLAASAQCYREIDIGAVVPAVLEWAWGVLIRRHPMLRAVALDDGCQHVLAQVEPYRLVGHDLRDMDEDGRNARYAAIRADLIGRSLPLGRWPQFCLLYSDDGEQLRLHLRFNLWILDGSSLQILTAELLRLCRAPEQPLPPLPAVFGWYAQSAVAAAAAPAAARARAYWTARLAGLPPGPALPLRCSPAELGRPRFVHLSETLSAAEWNALANGATARRLSPNSVMLAAFAAVLARWSRQRHFTLTLLMSRRAFAGEEFADVVGNFGSTLLLEVDARGRQSFAAFAAAVQRRMWDDMRHMDMSGLDVGRAYNRLHDTPFEPVAPVAFTSFGPSGEDGMAGAPELAGALQRHAHLQVPQVFLDHQVVTEAQGHITLNWDYVEGLFPDQVPQQMLAAYACLVRGLIAAPDGWDAPAVPAVPAAQRALLDAYNRTGAPGPDGTLDQLVWQRAATQGERAAVIDGALTLSYADLTREAERLRGALGDVALGQLIGVALPKGWRQIAAVLAIVRSGAAYVPIDPELPPARRAQLVAGARIGTVVTSAAIAQAGFGAQVRCIYADAPGMPAAPAPRGPGAHGTADLAYVIFTSGSTGQPKGVMIDHGGALNTIADLNRRLNLDWRDRVLALSSLSFDLSVWDIFGMLGAGGTVVLPGAADAQSPALWADLARRHAVTVWNSVPALFQLLTDACLQDGLRLPQLRHVLMSGDWIAPGLPGQGAAVAPNARLFSLGGATEASIWSVIHEIGAPDPAWRSVPYGRPLANQQLYVLDEMLAQCPLWCSGELYIGGRGVALAYLNDPQRSGERFVIHPDSGARLYRSGDLARMRPDGNMEFLGRADHQIKIRGFRIELGEIEATLLTHPGVAAALAKVAGSGDAGKRLVAFAVARPGAAPGAAALTALLEERLPRYMVPDAIYLLDALPLTANGKIDHRRLETMCTPAAAPAAGSVAADDADLQPMRELWEQVLGRRGIGARDSFYALGGTSFLALQLVARIGKRFGAALSLGDIPAGMTLEEMAARVKRCAGAGAQAGAALVELRPGGGAGPVVLCLHPVGGSPMCYLALARLLPDGTRVLGVQAAPAQPGEQISIEQLADQYAQLLEQALPTGPYLLVGWSMGAALAVELARRLLVRGAAVPFVGMVDPYRAALDVPAPGPAALLAAFCADLAGLAGCPFDASGLSGPIAAAAANPDGPAFAALIDELERRAILPPEAPVAELRAVLGVFTRNLQALLAYRPAPLEAPHTVFRALAGRPGRHLEPWVPAGAALEKIATADHFTIMQPPAVGQIAQALRRHLSFVI
jgi:amino acid adenylation domain-containing protein